MTKPATAAASAAEDILKTCMRQVGEDIQYTGKYDTTRGRRLMINRQVRFIGVFIERYPGDGSLPGVTLRRYYSPETPRAGSVKEDSRLGLGNEIFYIQCDTPVALQRLVDWYQQQ